jgi:hypothetical protein
VWVRSAAIRPVPGFAQLSSEALEDVEQWLGEDELLTEERLSEVFERFEREQPVLAERIGTQLARTRDEVALALGYFLTLAIWLAFSNSYGAPPGSPARLRGQLRVVDELALSSVEEALALDEKLRGEDPYEAVDSDDVVGMEQPFVLRFIHDHIDAALDVHAEETDVEAVHAIYRLLIVELLALSYAVVPAEGSPSLSAEICA